MLVDITVYDILSQYERFIIVYSLLSPSFNRRIYIITKTNEITPLISINSIFYVAG
jgi:NADH:ubiquinone oxidoreductase subunit C